MRAVGSIIVPQAAKDGKDANSPYIGYNGNWMIWDDDKRQYVDSGDPSRGETGKNGLAPRINGDNNWEIWDGEKWVDTGTKAKGEKGDDGKTLPGYRPRGLFTNGETYVYDSEYRDIILHVIGNSTGTFRVRKEGSSVTVAPTSLNGDANWEAANEFRFVATDFLFTDDAVIERLQSALITAEKIESLMIRTANIEILEGAIIKGTLDGVSGTFQKLESKEYPNAYVSFYNNQIDIGNGLRSLGDVDIWPGHNLILGSGVIKGFGINCIRTATNGYTIPEYMNAVIYTGSTNGANIYLPAGVPAGYIVYIYVYYATAVCINGSSSRKISRPDPTMTSTVTFLHIGTITVNYPGYPGNYSFLWDGYSWIMFKIS
ncbi:MAG TPA: hypothetical protein DDW85_03355 [Porphyromonadaceae bacterium]|nr:hypothetical protein [Porphyromonadaceae bacterium]